MNSDGNLARRPVACLVIAVALGTAIFAWNLSVGPTRAKTELETPPVLLWAWERKEDLGFIDPSQTGIVYLAGTIHLVGSDVLSRPRLNRLVFPTDTTLMPVIRVESDLESPPILSPEQCARTADHILAMSGPNPVTRLQIDFDAKVSERTFYRRLLEDLRGRLHPYSFLSITALASWCLDDGWIEDLPVDEAVPMLFRMGMDELIIRDRLATGETFRQTLCRSSAGLSSDEPIPPLRPMKRFYLFHPHSWSLDAFRKVSREIRKSKP